VRRTLASTNCLTHLNGFADTTVTALRRRLLKNLTKNSDEVGTTAVRPFKVNSLTLFTVIALLSVILIVLILPDLELPDTALQRNGSLQALRALSHQMPHPSVTPGQHTSFQCSGTCTLARQVHETRAWCFSDLPIQHKALRC